MWLVTTFLLVYSHVLGFIVFFVDSSFFWDCIKCTNYSFLHFKARLFESDKRVGWLTFSQWACGILFSLFLVLHGWIFFYSKDPMETGWEFCKQKVEEGVVVCACVSFGLFDRIKSKSFWRCETNGLSTYKTPSYVPFSSGLESPLMEDLCLC